MDISKLPNSIVVKILRLVDFKSVINANIACKK